MNSALYSLLTKPLLLILLSGFILTACTTTSTVNRENMSPEVEQKFAVAGHIEQKKTPENTNSIAHSIPDLVTKKKLLPPKPSELSQSKKYSVSAVNIPVNELLFKLAQDANKQLDLHTGIKGLITINAINQDLNTILSRIAVQSGFIFEVSNTSISIRPDQPFWKNYFVDYVNIKKVSQDTIDMKMSVGGASGVGSSVGTGASAANIKLESEHDFWPELEENLGRMVSVSGGLVPASAGVSTTTVNKNVVVNEETGVVTIFATGLEHRAVSTYIDAITNRADKQVLIEATVVEVELSDQYQAGIDWSTLVKSDSGNGVLGQSLIPTTLSSNAAVAFNFTGIGGDWDLGLRMLQQFGNTQVLSSPKIMAVNNQTALLKVVNNEVYFTIEVNREAATATSAGTTTYETEVHTVPVGFMMSVTPFVSEDNSVSLNIRPTISRIVGYVNDPSPDLARENIISRIPIIQEREMASVLKLNNRQTAVIGGLIEDTNANDKNGVPWANELPFVGDLFSYKDDNTTKSELVIFIRPIVVTNPDVDHGDLQSLRSFLKTTRSQ